MKAAQISSYGGVEQIKINDQANKPEADDNQILVQAKAASINPFDLMVLSGNARGMAELNFPAVLGGDVSGTNSETGEEVYGLAGALSSQGSFAEYVPVSKTQLAAKPKNISFEQAAALPLAGVSAYQALVEHINLQPGQKVLIHGGAGGIGTLAIQIAKSIGAHVATTASAKDEDFLKTLGADLVIDYKNKDFTEEITDYDAVFDTVGGETYEKSFKVVKPGGVVVTMAAQANDELAKEHGVKTFGQFTHVTTEKLAALTELVESGAVKPLLDSKFKLDDLAEAISYQQTGHPKGKVVIQIQ